MGSKLDVGEIWALGNIRANVSNAGGFYLTNDTGVVRNNSTGVAVRTAGVDRLVVDIAGMSHFTTNVAGDTEVIRVENLSADRNAWASFFRTDLEYGRLGTSDGYLSLQSQNSKPVRVIDDGGNGMSIADGGLASFSAGIAFSGQTDASGTGITSGASTLNHYEEGTWTPTWVLNADGSAVQKSGGDITYASQSGRYTRIGNQVTCNFYVQVNAAASSAANFAIGGLPFPSSSVAPGHSNNFFSAQSLATAFDGFFVSEMATSASWMRIRTQAVNSTTPAGTPNANTYIGANTWMMGQFTYFA